MAVTGSPYVGLACYSALFALVNAAAFGQRTFEVVDVQAVRAEGDPQAWIHRIAPPANTPEVSCDILVAGAGMGGTAAALRGAASGLTVCLTDPTDWMGGQMTSGGVSALDENAFIETSGGTRSYYTMRNAIREAYRRKRKLTPAAQVAEDLNPGACYVSALCFEPRIGVRVLEEMLAVHKTRIHIYPRTEVVDLELAEGRITTALAYRFDKREFVRLRPKWVLDATEVGDLLPLAKVPYVVGSEAHSETGEPHAAEAANAACVQSFTYPFVIEHRPGESHSIEKPPQYEYFRDAQPFSLRMFYPPDFGWRGYVQYAMFGDDPAVPNNMSPRPFFSWRRIAAKSALTDLPGGELALMNWPRQDYHSESLLDRTPQDFARVLQQAKRVSFSFLYWLQHDLRRDDGRGNGYPELLLRKDIMATEDGLSQYPYVRESRRLRARATVREQDIVAEYQSGSRARWFSDSIGIGFYMVDIHPCGANERGRMMMPKPFQIPMGTLVPATPTNFLAAGKNIGVTHLTNGAFRLHPIEWNIGEAAAVIAALAIRDDRLPEARAVQLQLVQAGVPLVWFDDLPVTHPAFASIHLAAIRGLYPLSSHDLHAAPDAPVTRFEAAQALATLFLGQGLIREAAATLACERGWMAVDHRNWFHGDLPLKWTDFREDRFPSALPAHQPRRRGPVSRAEFALRLAGQTATR